jgi:uncharacterized protein YuzE
MIQQPTATYDPEADALFISLTPIAYGELAQSVPYEAPEGSIDLPIYLHFDHNGRLRGIEILTASRVLPPSGKGSHPSA